MTETVIYGIAFFDYHAGRVYKDFPPIAFWTLKEANSGALKMATQYGSRRGLVTKGNIVGDDLPAAIEMHTRKGVIVRRYVVRKITVYGSPLVALAKQAEE